MSEYDLLELIFEFEKAGVDYGQYIMAGMFAYVVTMFLLAQRMTKTMVVLISGIYTLYVFFLMAGVMQTYSRASQLSADLPERYLAAGGAFENTVEGYYLSGIALCGFWLLSYVASIVFVVLV